MARPIDEQQRTPSWRAERSPALAFWKGEPAERFGRLHFSYLALAAPLVLGGCDRAPSSSQPEPTASGSASVAQPASVAPAASSAAASEPSADELCQRFGSAPVPSEDQPAADETAALRGCDAEALYYGIGAPADFERARHCAYAALGQDGDKAIGSAEILMMLYANGRAVPANLDLALRFACQVGGAPFELGGRVSRLWQARSGARPLGPFDVCDDVTSGNMQGYCAAHEERVAAPARDARRRAATAGMPAELRALEDSAQRFFDARAKLEVDRSGTLRGVLSIEERAKLEDDFVKTLEQLRDRGFVPDRLDANTVDKKLAAQLARIASCKNLADLEAIAPGVTTRAGIKKTHALWVAYRAAFVALAQKVRPDVERAAWHAFVTEKRTLQLAELADGC
ncbi:MAG TPA: hypothetical protein VEQ59_03630 [Polyangiaceae bacterium]|nr:hypothetical protein [Polyangiaceae bacterium]